MTSQEIRNTEFETVRKGYRPEDVDDYLSMVADELDRVTAERDAAQVELAAAREQFETQLAEELATAIMAKEDAEAKMYVLAEKVEEYRGQEDNLKNALINAQRMGETVVHEAKQKAEQIVREATGSSELITQKAEREVIRERATLEKIQGEVKQFKTTILSLYKQHIESLSALDPPVEKAQVALDNSTAYAEKTAEPAPAPAPEAAMEPEPAPVAEEPQPEPAEAPAEETAPEPAAAEPASYAITEDLPPAEGALFEPVLLSSDDLDDDKD